MAKCLFFRQTMATGPEQISLNGEIISSDTNSTNSDIKHLTMTTSNNSITTSACSASSTSSSSSENYIDLLSNSHINTIPGSSSCFTTNNSIISQMTHDSSGNTKLNSTTAISSSIGTNYGITNSQNDLTLSSTDFFNTNGNWDNFIANLNLSNTSLTDSILDSDSFLRNFDLNDSGLKMETSTSVNGTVDCIFATSSNTTPTNVSPIQTPKQTSPVRELPPSVNQMKQPIMSWSLQQSMKKSSEAIYLSEEKSSGSSLSDSGGNWSRDTHHIESQSRPNGTFRNLTTGLETIPENGVTNPPSIYQPLVPVPVAKVATTSYNISFPTTLQPRDRFDTWLRASGNNRDGSTPGGTSTGGYSSPAGGGSSSFPASPASHSSTQSPFHGATRSTPYDPNEFHPLNVIKEHKPKSSKKPRRSVQYTTQSAKQGSSGVNIDDAEMEEYEEGSSSRRHRRKSAGSHVWTSNSTENKRRDSIKFGLEELQRVLPHIGTPEEEKISQASVLFEGGKYIKNLQNEHDRISEETKAVKKRIDDLNNYIEMLQNQLPANGAPLLPKVMALKTLPDQFHDHVVQQTKENWKYWVYVSIMGHFVHSFEQQVSAATFEDLQTTAHEYVGNNLSLQQLRKDAYRKLAKLCAKTSIVDTPGKLPEEALAFVSRGDRAFKKEMS